MIHDITNENNSQSQKSLSTTIFTYKKQQSEISRLLTLFNILFSTYFVFKALKDKTNKSSKFSFIKFKIFNHEQTTFVVTNNTTNEIISFENQQNEKFEFNDSLFVLIKAINDMFRIKLNSKTKLHNIFIDSKNIEFFQNLYIDIIFRFFIIIVINSQTNTIIIVFSDEEHKLIIIIKNIKVVLLIKFQTEKFIINYWIFVCANFEIKTMNYYHFVFSTKKKRNLLCQQNLRWNQKTFNENSRS